MLPLALALTQTAAEAEAAFNRAAQTGQWEAFRAFAADDAIMFVPEPARAHDFLKDRKDPPIAVQWWPAVSFVACDGASAVNTGPWVRSGAGSVGYFTTIWRRGADGWKWTYDGGDGLAVPRPAGDRPRILHASCRGRPAPLSAGHFADGTTGEGRSADGTLAWRWHVAPEGARSFDAWLWDGRRMRTIVSDRVAPKG